MLLYMMDVDDYKQFVSFKDQAAADIWLAAQTLLNSKMDGWQDGREWVKVGEFAPMSKAEASAFANAVNTIKKQEKLESIDAAMHQKHGFESFEW